MNQTRTTIACLLFGLFLTLGNPLVAQYSFTIEKDHPATPVKDQHRTGTCWSFAMASFLESELLRTGHGEHDLSEMFFVRKAYELKADYYVRKHGKTNFGNGGLAMDVLHVWKKFGALPEEFYTGSTWGNSLPVHGEMDALLKSYVETVVTHPTGSLSPVWKRGFEGILDAYLGPVPEAVDTEEAWTDARSYADATGLDPSDYISLTSFTHHPFYSDFILEIPDNWLWSSVYNIPLDELMEVLDGALEGGYTLCWDADVGETGYGWDKGIAMLPVYDEGSLEEPAAREWERLTSRQKRKEFYDFFQPEKELEVTQEKRQRWFDDYTTTDDHLMHITGWATGQDGKKYYRVKNSWGSEDHIYGGFHYVSENYMKGKTIFLMVHKDALPLEMIKKLGL
jgi:bleomycin hydrolase